MIRRGLIAPHLFRPVAAWAAHSYRSFQPNGFARQFMPLDRIAHPPEAMEIKRLVMLAFGIPRGAAQERLYRDYCGVHTEGGAVHRHTDAPAEHWRFNVMVARPEAGGMPVIDGAELDVSDGDAWQCHAGGRSHWSMPVQGGALRVVLSFGFLLPGRASPDDLYSAAPPPVPTP